MALAEEFESQGNFLFKHRGLFPFIIIAIGLGLFALAVSHQPLGSRTTIFQSPYAFICLGIVIFGLLIRIVTVGFTPANTSGRNTGEQLADDLNGKGIYSLLRHPLYLGNYFMWLGFAMLPQSIWFVLVFSLVYQLYYERIMFAEEQFLTKKYGERYLAWAAKTPAFIPATKNFIPPSLSFSLKKVLKQEKNSVLYVCVLMYLFQALEQYLTSNKLSFIDNYWFYVMVASVVIYAVLKTMKYKTEILEEPGR